MKFNKVSYICILIFLPLLALLFNGISCSREKMKNSNPPRSAYVFPKIGVIADTQITTDKGGRVLEVRSLAADYFNKVAIRTPTLEHLDEKIIEYFLNKLSEHNVDLILYLGDGANSGCNDEIKALFDKLKTHRTDSGIPIYFVIGNHDYLGNGNLTYMPKRKILCGKDKDNKPNKPLNKFEVMEKAHEFNIGNNKISDKFIYEDNFSAHDWGSYKIKQICFENNENREHLNGCFLAGIISMRGNPDFEIFLTDTSDYKDIYIQPVEWYGTKGAISFVGDKSQIYYFSEFGSNPMVRLIASHYQPTEFEFPFSKYLFRDFVGRPGDLLLQKGYNIWISAHTHDPYLKTQKIIVDRSLIRTLKFLSNEKQNEKYFVNINIGSTTDYPPHAIILTYDNFKFESVDEIYSASEKHCPFLMESGENWCDTILKSMEMESDEYIAINNIKSGQKIFGLDQEYKKWSKEEIEHSQNNIDEFIANWVDKYSSNFKEKEIEQYLVACLTNTSAKYEKEVTDTSQYKNISKPIEYPEVELQQIKKVQNELQEDMELLNAELSIHQPEWKKIELQKTKSRSISLLKEMEKLENIYNKLNRASRAESKNKQDLELIEDQYEAHKSAIQAQAHAFLMFLEGSAQAQQQIQSLQDD